MPLGNWEGRARHLNPQARRPAVECHQPLGGVVPAARVSVNGDMAS